MITPILNNLFEFTYKGSGNNQLLNELSTGYELRSDRGIIIIKYLPSEEELYSLVESVKLVSNIGILIHDSAGVGIMKISAHSSYLGPIIKQEYNPSQLFEFYACFKIENTLIHAIKKD